jgi:hypothetical protein
MSLPNINKRLLPDMYNKYVGNMGMPDFSQPPAQTPASQPDFHLNNPALAQIQQMPTQQPVQEPTMPAIGQSRAGGMSDYELTQNASADAKQAGVAQMTPEKRAHWARLDNEFAAEKIRRKEEKEAEKKKAMTTNQIGNMVRSGALTPEGAVKTAKLHDIETTAEYYANNYLPKVRDSRRPNLPTIDEYKMQKQAQQQAEYDMAMADEKLNSARIQNEKTLQGMEMAAKPPVLPNLQIDPEKGLLNPNTGQFIVKPVPKTQQPVSVGQGETLVDPASGKVIATGQVATPDAPKPSYKEQLAIDRMSSMLNRELTPEEKLDAINPATEKTAPQAFYTSLEESYYTHKTIQDIGKLIDGGVNVTGILDSIWAKVKKGIGAFSAEEQEFLEKYTKLYSLMRNTVKERMSDRDYENVKDVRPSLLLNDKAFKATIARMATEERDKITKQVRDLKDLRFRVPSSYEEFDSDNATKSDPLGIR